MVNYNNLDEFQQTWSWQPFCELIVKNSGGNSFVERSKMFHPQNVISLSIGLIVKPHTGFGRKGTATILVFKCLRMKMETPYTLNARPNNKEQTYKNAWLHISQGVWPHIHIDGRNAESLTSLRSNENVFISVFQFVYLVFGTTLVNT